MSSATLRGRGTVRDLEILLTRCRFTAPPHMALLWTLACHAGGAPYGVPAPIEFLPWPDRRRRQSPATAGSPRDEVNGRTPGACPDRAVKSSRTHRAKVA